MENSTYISQVNQRLQPWDGRIYHLCTVGIGPFKLLLCLKGQNQSNKQLKKSLDALIKHLRKQRNIYTYHKPP